MNKKKREKLNRARRYLEQASDIVDAVRDAESDAMSNMPENLQDSERYDKMESAVDNLDEALDHISDAIEAIESASA